MHLIIVHRLLQSILLPPLNAMILMAIGLMLRKKRTMLIILGLLLFYIQSIPLTSYFLAKSIETKSVVNASTLAHAGAIVVLGGGVNNNSFEYPDKVYPGPDTLIRLSYTAYLAKSSPKTLIIASGGYTGNKFKEADVMRDILRTRFLVTNPIIVENLSRNTAENAKYTAQILKQLDIHNIIVVTQAFHMQRAMMLFAKYNLNVTAAPTDFTCDYDAKTKALMFIPNAHSLATTARTLHELLGELVYKLGII